MRSRTQLGRSAVLAVLGIAAVEVLVMISPFAGFLYSTVGFEPLLGLFSRSALTAWLDGFFLNHAVVTDSPWLEGQRTIGQYVLSLSGYPCRDLEACNSHACVTEKDQAAEHENAPSIVALAGFGSAGATFAKTLLLRRLAPGIGLLDAQAGKSGRIVSSYSGMSFAQP